MWHQVSARVNLLPCDFSWYWASRSSGSPASSARESGAFRTACEGCKSIRCDFPCRSHCPPRSTVPTDGRCSISYDGCCRCCASSRLPPSACSCMPVPRSERSATSWVRRTSARLRVSRAVQSGVLTTGTFSDCPAIASIAGVLDAGLSKSPSHRAITTVARQLPSTLIDVRAMSISASTPRMTATACKRQPELRQRAGEDHQRRARNGGDAFAREHQRQHHHELRARSACRPPRPAPRTPTRAPDRACFRRG